MRKKEKDTNKADRKPINPEIAKSLIMSATAIVCTIVIGLTAVSVTNKICDTDIKLAESKISNAESVQGNETDDVIDGVSDDTVEDVDAAVDVDGEQVSQGDSSVSGDTSSESKADKDNNKSTTKAGTASTAKKVGLNSTDKAEVLKFYVAATKATGNNVTITRTKTLEKLNGGNGAVGSIITKLESVGKKALADNSGEDKGLRGSPELIKTDDIKSANATVSGNYTNLTMNIKDYTAAPEGRAKEGSVGRAIGVLDTLDEALNELPITVVDDTSGVKLYYTDAVITAKVDNKTNKIVSAEWTYVVKIAVNNTKVKALGIPITLDGAEIVIRYEATL